MLQHAQPARPSSRSARAESGRGSQPSPQSPARAGAASGWAFRATGGATLPLSRPGDRDEVEADRLADRVLAPGGAALTLALSRPDFTPRVRRCAKCAAAGVPCTCGEEEQVRRKQAASTGEMRAVDAAPVRAVAGRPGTPLDAPTRAFFEMRFGRDLGGVRVHADAAAADSARSVNALAYTLGSSVVFGAGQYAPESQPGRRLLAHELAHVVQQQDGAGPAVRRTPAPGAPDSAPAPHSPSAPAPARRPFGVRPPEGSDSAEVLEYYHERDQLVCRGEPLTRPPRCTFDPPQQAMITALTSGALAWAARAEARVRAGHPGVAAAATRIFNLTAAPDLPAMAATIANIAATLRARPILCASCGEWLCQRGDPRRPSGAVYAVVPNDLQTILICPYFFSPETSNTFRRRTLLHEAGHAAGIDNATDYHHPPYCSDADHDCVNPCTSGAGLANVDAWAWFIQCMAGTLSADPEPCTFTPQQRSLATASRFDALSVAGRAAQAAGSGDRYIAMLAQRILHDADMERIANTAVLIRRTLGGTPVSCGAAGDAVCGDADPGLGQAPTLVAVSADLGTLFLCPTFFTAGIGERRRALLREAARLSRVDTAYSLGAGDRCDPSATSCSDPCPSVTGPASADAWPWFIECAAFRY